MGKAIVVKENRCSLCGSGCNYSRLHTFTETVNKFACQLDTNFTSITCAAQVPLCPECYSGVVNAVEWRDQVEEVERDVRSLQRIILKMMRQLTTLQKSYLGEMSKFEENVRRTEISPTAKEVDVIRQGVLNVVTELRQFSYDGFAKENTHGCKYKNKKNLNANTQVNKLSTPKPSLNNEPATPLEPIVSPILQTNSLPLVPLKEEDCQDSGTENITIEHVILSHDPVKSEPDPPSILPDDPVPPPQNPQQQQHKHSHGSCRCHSCKYCGKIFNTFSHLKSHLLIHTGELPFKCSLCGRAFRHQTSLLIHRRQHAGERPYQCPECPKNFNRADSYKTHLRTHTGERPYACRICGKRFTQSNYVRKYMSREHPNETAT